MYLPAVRYVALVLPNGGYAFGKLCVISIFPKKHLEQVLGDDFTVSGLNYVSSKFPINPPH